MAAGDTAPKAKAAALRALELDTSLPEAHTSLATVRFNYDWDWPAAASGFKRAIELDPNYATAYQRYSLYLMAMGQTQESFDKSIGRANSIRCLSALTSVWAGGIISPASTTRRFSSSAIL
jgi:Tfp pilus assembly protein PilF